MGNRIEFIDLAKGIGIVWLVLGHCGIMVDMPGLVAVPVPLFFVISGLFFKDYGGFVNCLIKKVNSLLVPFIFFYVISYLLYYVFNLAVPGLIKTEANGIMDVFTQRQYFNGPIWFLLSLFWSNIILCAILSIFQTRLVRCLVVVILGAIGVWLGLGGYFLPCAFDVALTSMPLLYVGYLLRSTNVLTVNISRWLCLLIAFGCWLVSFVIEYIFGVQYISWHYNQIVGNVALIIVMEFSSVMAILFLCKAINHLPLLDYWGRYSLILLSTHHLVYRPLLLFCNLYVTAAVTLLICSLVIPLCCRLVPWFVAQKELIRIPKDNGRITEG